MTVPALGLPDKSFLVLGGAARPAGPHMRPPDAALGRLERVLNRCGVSYGGKYDLEGHYSDRLACSLDLVQWPTNPLWSEIPKEAQAKLLEDGRPFVELVLEKNPSIGLLLGNGHTVVRELEQAFSVQLETCRPSAKMGHKRG